MKRYFLFLIILLFNIINAKGLEDTNKPMGNNLLQPESTQLTDSALKTTTLTDSSQKEWKLGYEQGRLDGSKKSQIGWFASGCVGGGLGCCLGGGIVWFIANAKEYKPYIMPERDTAYKACYLKGYKESSKDKKTSAAFLGSITGTVCFLLAYVIISEALSGLEMGSGN